MKAISRLVGIVAVLFVLAGCSLVNSPNLPSFLANESLTRIEVINNQTGQHGLATSDLDNLNELLNDLHLGDLTIAARVATSAPTSSVYTIIAYEQDEVAWTVRVLDAPDSSRVYLSDALHPANSGIYPLKQAISGADLAQFISKYPAS